MRAVVIEHPGDPDVLQLRDVPRPVPRVGEVLIRVRAFGLNQSELHFRRGQGSFGSFPRVPGIEATGDVAQAPGGEFAIGQQVATFMGGMGRTFDGGYAEFVLVPAAQVIPFASGLSWDVLGAIPETLQTAYGSLSVGVRLKPGDTLLIRGGTSAVGLMLAVLGKMHGLTVLSTTRSTARMDLLRSVDVDHPLVDDGAIAAKVRALVPDGVDGAVELVGVTAMRDTLQATRPGGTTCFTGMLADDWTIPDFYPMEWLPNGVRLTAYSGEASDLPPQVLQTFLDEIAVGRAKVPVGRVFALEDIVAAHRAMEEGTLGGKGVVVVER